MQTRLIDGIDGLLALRAGWESLESQATLPMQQFIWAQACAETLTRQDELRIVVLEEAGQTVAIAPLVHRKGRHCLELLGMAELQEPTDVLYADVNALQSLAIALVKLGVPLHLKRISADSLLPNELEKITHGRRFRFCRPDNSWPWIPLNPDWVEPESQMDSKRRSHFRRIKRIADEFGTVSSQVLSPEPATLARLLEEAFAVEAAGWKGKTGTAMAMDPLRGAFYRHYAAAACHKGILRLCFLRINDQPAAMQLGIESGDGIWLLKVGYDHRFARCSPGNLLVLETLRYAAMRGLKALHFLGAVEYWTTRWTELEKSCVAIRTYPFGLRGVTVFAGDVVKSTRHKLGRALHK